MTDLDRALQVLEALISTAPDYFSTWGQYRPDLVSQLETFWGHRLSSEVTHLCSRWPNIHLGYTSIDILGPVQNLPAAQLLTQDERSYWRVPANELVIARENTDIVLLQSAGSIVTRDGSTERRVIFERYESLGPFLLQRLRQNVDILYSFGDLDAGASTLFQRTLPE